MSETSNYKRIVVKAGTSLLTDGGDFLNSKIIQSLVSQISELQSSGYQMVYVSSGAGCWGPKMRLGSQNEIVELILISN